MDSKSPLPIAFDSRWIGDNGIGRFANEISARISFLHKINNKTNPASFASPLLIEYWLRSNNVSNFFSPGFIPPISAKFNFSFTLHDLNHIDIPHNSNLLKRLFYSKIIKPAIHRAKFVFTVSDYSKQRIVEWSKCNPEKIINVGNGVSNSFSLKVQPATPGFPYIFCCSSRKHHKNERRLITSYKNSNLSKEVKLVISGVCSKELGELLLESSLQDSVIFTGRLSEAQLSSWYRGATASIFPSLYEGFGIPIIESMACGTPVITSNTTSMPEIAGDAAILVNPYSTEEIAHAMQRIVADQDLRVRMHKKGLIRAKDYTWDITADLVKKSLYEL